MPIRLLLGLLRHGCIAALYQALIRCNRGTHVHSKSEDAGVSQGRKGYLRTEEGERSLAISALRRRLGVLTIRCEACLCLLGRLETIGLGSSAAAGRRWQAAELERSWRPEGRRGRTPSPLSRAGEPTEPDSANWTSSNNIIHILKVLQCNQYPSVFLQPQLIFDRYVKMEDIENKTEKKSRRLRSSRAPHSMFCL